MRLSLCLITSLCVVGVFTNAVSHAQQPIDASIAALADQESVGIAAYRNRDYPTAWAMLAPLAEKGLPRAQRFVATMLLNIEAPVPLSDEDRQTRAVAYLIDAARNGDNNALITLETMRTKMVPFGPSQLAIVEVEKYRAERGDALTAWRLAQRYQIGDGVTIDQQQEIYWLQITAADQDYPYADDAAYRLCEVYAQVGPNDAKETPVSIAQAQHWCSKATRQGNSAAAITLARLKETRLKVIE